MDNEQPKTEDEIFAKYAPKKRRHQEVNGGDPAPNPTAIHRERLVQVVNNISLQSLDELRAMRDQVDALMMAISEREGTVLHDVEEFANIAQSALDTKKIIGDALAALQARFAASELHPTLKDQRQLPSAPTIESDHG